MSVLPTKLYFRIGEVANAVGVETHVLATGKTEFRSIRPQKSSRGQRVYSRRDVRNADARQRAALRSRVHDRRRTASRLRDGGIEPREPADPTLRGRHAHACRPHRDA